MTLFGYYKMEHKLISFHSINPNTVLELTNQIADWKL